MDGARRDELITRYREGPAVVDNVVAGLADEELELARRISEALAARIGPAVEALYPGTVDPPSRPRRWRRRLTGLLLGPGPLEHDERA